MQSASPVVTESVSIVVIKILVVENFYFKDYYFIDVLVVEDNITCQIAHNVYPKYRNLYSACQDSSHLDGISHLCNLHVTHSLGHWKC